MHKSNEITWPIGQIQLIVIISYFYVIFLELQRPAQELTLNQSNTPPTHTLLKCYMQVSFSCISSIIKQSPFPNFTFFTIFYKDCKVLWFQKFWQSKNNKGLSLHPVVNMNLSPIAVLESKEIALQPSKDDGVKKWIGQLYN